MGNGKVQLGFENARKHSVLCHFIWGNVHGLGENRCMVRDSSRVGIFLLHGHIVLLSFWVREFRNCERRGWGVAMGFTGLWIRLVGSGGIHGYMKRKMSGLAVPTERTIWGLERCGHCIYIYMNQTGTFFVFWRNGCFYI